MLAQKHTALKLQQVTRGAPCKVIKPFIAASSHALRCNDIARRPNFSCNAVEMTEFATSGSVVEHFDVASIQQYNEVFQLGEGLETPIQLIYLLTLLGFLAGGAYLVSRQVLIRRELDEAAKALGERIRTGEATCEDYYELGVILTRKKLFTQATKNLEKAKKLWDGEETELAQVHNALGYCYFQMDRSDLAVSEYQRAVELQPGYVTAWNNLGDAYEKQKNWRQALAAYQESLSYAPNNEVAMQRSNFCKQKVENMPLY